VCGALLDASKPDHVGPVTIGYLIGAALMVVGGIAEAVLRVKAEGRSLESVAKPLTAE
jgi:hypothetical protein